MNDFGKAMAALITLAILAVIVSNRAKTAEVVTSAFQAFDNLMQVIVSPITQRQHAGGGGGGLLGSFSGALLGGSPGGSGGLLGSILDPTKLVGSIDMPSGTSLSGFGDFQNAIAGGFLGG